MMRVNDGVGVKGACVWPETKVKRTWQLKYIEQIVTGIREKKEGDLDGAYFSCLSYIWGFSMGLFCSLWQRLLVVNRWRSRCTFPTVNTTISPPGRNVWRFPFPDPKHHIYGMDQLHGRRNPFLFPCQKCRGRRRCIVTRLQMAWSPCSHLQWTVAPHQRLRVEWSI